MKPNNSDFTLIVTVFLGFLAVIFGAFGAHGLEEKIADKTLHAYNTGVLYHFLHVLVLLVLGFQQKIEAHRLRWTVRFYLGGILLFSGSLYAMAFLELMQVSVTFLGPITPVGGVLFLVAWGSLLSAILKK